jgi:hypothetical protein
MAERLRWSLRWRLSVLWVLEWGITGAVLTYLPLYLEEHSLKPDEVGPLLATGAVGLWVAPFVVGQICDRWMAAERYLALAHFVGGLTLIAIPIATNVYRETQSNYNVILALFGLYAAVYVPTMPLASALTFRHLSDTKRQFGGVRVWGTVGWVLAGIGLSCWLERATVDVWLRGRFPERARDLDRIASMFHWLPAPTSQDCFYIASILSFALSTFCVFLPHTPPARAPRSQFAPVAVLGMFRQRSFVQLLAASCLLSLVIPLYSIAVPPLLNRLHFARDWVPAVMTIGQISEFPSLLLLPLFLRRLGLKMTFALGIAAWFVRYVIFAYFGGEGGSAFGSPRTWILSGIALHGVCHVFLIVVIQLYLDAECPADLRNSVQNLFAFLTLGVAMPAGMMLSQPLIRWCTIESPDGTETINFRAVFLAASMLLVVLMLVFWWYFESAESRSTRRAAEESAARLAESATPVPRR